MYVEVYDVIDCFPMGFSHDGGFSHEDGFSHDGGFFPVTMGFCDGWFFRDGGFFYCTRMTVAQSISHGCAIFCSYPTIKAESFFHDIHFCVGF